MLGCLGQQAFRVVMGSFHEHAIIFKNSEASILERSILMVSLNYSACSKCVCG